MRRFEIRTIQRIISAFPCLGGVPSRRAASGGHVGIRTEHAHPVIGTISSSNLARGGLCLAWLLLLGPIAPRPAAGVEKGTPARSRPNILFCVADDASYPYMSAYDCRWVQTPNFDRVAKEGILFTHAYTPDAKCAPSRSCILTGRNPWQLEAAGNHDPFFPPSSKSTPRPSLNMATSWARRAKAGPRATRGASMASPAIWPANRSTSDAPSRPPGTSRRSTTLPTSAISLTPVLPASPGASGTAAMSRIGVTNMAPA